MCKERTIPPLHPRVGDVLEPPKGVTNQGTKSNFVEYDGLVRGCPPLCPLQPQVGDVLEPPKEVDEFHRKLFFSRLLVFWLKIGQPIVCEGPLRSSV